MINNLALVKKVLEYIFERRKITLDEFAVNSNWGFPQLAEAGLIRIQKKGNEYTATLTDKGIEILMN
jgi:predicted transcriptional regulator